MGLADPIAQEDGANRVSFCWADYHPTDKGRQTEYAGQLVTTPATLLSDMVLSLVLRSSGVSLQHRASVYGPGGGSRYDARLETDSGTLDEDVRAKGVLATDVVLAEMVAAGTHPEATSQPRTGDQ